MKNDNVKQTLGYTQNSAAVGAAIGSMLPVYVAAQSAAMNYINIFWVSILIGVIAVFLFALVVEYGMRTYFPYGMKGILSGNAFKKGWQSSALFIIITGLAALLMFSSGYMSFEGRKEAGKLAAGKIETSDIASISADISQNENSLLRVARSEKAQVSKAIQERKKEIRSGNKKLVKLSNRANDEWAGPELDRIINADPKLKQLEIELKQKSETIGTLLKQSAVSKAVETVSEENAIKLETWKERHETSKALVGWFGIVSIIIFAISSVVIVLYEIVHEDETSINTVVSAPPPSELIPVSGVSATIERKVDFALKQGAENRSEIVSLKQNNIVSTEISTENSEPETVSETKPETFEIVSKGNQKAIWVPGFRTEAFSLSQCRSKLRQYEYKLKEGKGKKETNQDNINKFNKAIKLLS